MNFTRVKDIGDVRQAVKEALELKKDRFQYQEIGRNKTALLIFFNNSLRTRLSTQKAATNLGMNVIVLDINQGAWRRIVLLRWRAGCRSLDGRMP